MQAGLTKKAQPGSGFLCPPPAQVTRPPPSGGGSVDRQEIFSCIFILSRYHTPSPRAIHRRITFSSSEYHPSVSTHNAMDGSHRVWVETEIELRKNCRLANHRNLQAHSIFSTPCFQQRTRLPALSAVSGRGNQANQNLTVFWHGSHIDMPGSVA